MKNPENSGTMEPRANPYHDEKGRFASAGAGKTKYAPSQRRNNAGISVGKKKYAKLSQYPGLKAGEECMIRDATYRYFVTADGFGGMTVHHRFKIRDGG